jgi:hypothetical protein
VELGGRCFRRNRWQAANATAEHGGLYGVHISGIAGPALYAKLRLLYRNVNNVSGFECSRIETLPQGDQA